MARYIGPKGKLSRREGKDLLLKSGIRSYESKCRSETSPSNMVEGEDVFSDYGIQQKNRR